MKQQNFHRNGKVDWRTLLHAQLFTGNRRQCGVCGDRAMELKEHARQGQPYTHKCLACGTLSYLVEPGSDKEPGALNITQTALYQLRQVLSDALDLLNRAGVSADELKDMHFEIGKAFRPAVEELRAMEAQAMEAQAPHWTDNPDCAGVG